MAHKKGAGSVERQARDSNAQRRGVKKFGGEAVKAGNVLIRQCGARFRPGFNVGVGRDWTLYALIDGTVKYESGRRVSVFSASHPEPGYRKPAAKA